MWNRNKFWVIKDKTTKINENGNNWTKMIENDVIWRWKLKQNQEKSQEFKKWHEEKLKNWHENDNDYSLNAQNSENRKRSF